MSLLDEIVAIGSLHYSPWQIFGCIAAGYAVLYVEVLAHELGHLIAARLSGARITDYSVGDGPVVLAFLDEFSATWVFRLYPTSGYVRLDPQSEISDLKDFVISAAGPAVNIAIGFYLLIVWSNFYDDFNALFFAAISSIAIGGVNAMPLSSSCDGGHMAQALSRMIMSRAVRTKGA